MNMTKQASNTEAVVRNHLQTFLEQKGVDAILEDYNEDSRLYGEARTYHGKQQIHDFFEAFIAALPPRAYERFALRSLRVDGPLAYITWNVGDDIPLGTDTFVVEKGKIVSQTFAMHVAKANA
jgi:ketosteroid isomerase-like protein